MIYWLSGLRVGEDRISCQSGPLMLVYFAVFSAFVVCAGGLVARIYEWRQDVLSGPFVVRDAPPQKRKGWWSQVGREHPCAKYRTPMPWWSNRRRDTSRIVEAQSTPGIALLVELEPRARDEMLSWNIKANPHRHSRFVLAYWARRRRIIFEPSCQCHITTSSFDTSDCLGRAVDCLGGSIGTIFVVSTAVWGKALSNKRDGSRSPLASAGVKSSRSAAIAFGAARPTAPTSTTDLTANRPQIPARQNSANRISLFIS